ncbi:MAG TPA: hypothetical protein VKB47_01260 [Terracidiphilus sp.]|jgi:hypothetical protein|nr:hypothetical protein [Terracidiphilus sp.]
MKKATVLGFLLAVAIGASAQSATKVLPNAHGKGVGPVAIPGPTATNSTVNVPPIAKVPPVAVGGGKRK